MAKQAASRTRSSGGIHLARIELATFSVLG